MYIKLKYLLITLPIVFFAIPLKMGNNIAQPVAMLLLFSMVIIAAKKSFAAFFFIFFVLSISIYQAMWGGHVEYSVYQFLRSGIPFFFFCIILVGYDELYNRLLILLEKSGEADNVFRYLIVMVYIFSFGQLLQVLLFSYDIDIANAASKSASGFERILLFPTSCSLLVFLYAVCSKRYILIAAISVVLILTGSKTLLASGLLMALIAMVKLGAFHSTKHIVMFLVIGIMATYSNVVVIERVENYIFNEKLEDVTREYEISHAKESFYSGIDTVIFGNGLAVPLTPGVPTDDDRWFENSKYDIENGYWGILAKLGVIGTVLFLFLFIRLPKDFISLAVIFILLLFSFKTSYQFFTTFDGSYLLFFSIVLRMIFYFEHENSQ